VTNSTSHSFSAARLTRGLALAGAALLPVAAVAGDVPPRTAGGQALAVPDALLDSANVYHVTPGEDAQLVITSDALLQRNVLTCRRVVGYIATPFEGEENQPPILGAALRIPVRSLVSGSRSTDDTVHGAAFLNAAEHAEITFLLESLRDPTPRPGRTNGGAAIAGTAVGKLGFLGRTLPIEAPVELEFCPFSRRTMFGRYPGDLLTLRASFELSLETLGIKRPSPAMNDTLADTLRFDLFLLANTVTMEKSLDPDVPTTQLVKHLAFLTRLRDFKDPEAYDVGRKLAAEFNDDARALNRLAHDVMNEDGIDHRDLAFAEQCARRANEVSKHENAALLDTLAEVCYRKGDLAAAVEWQKKAVERLGDDLPPPTAAGIRANLEKYEAALKACGSAGS